MATKSKAIDVTDTFKNPRTFAQASIRFYRERKFGAKKARLVVVLSYAADEPIYRFPTSVANARVHWKAFLDRLRSEGYTRRIDRKIVTEKGRVAARPGVRV